MGKQKLKAINDNQIGEEDESADWTPAPEWENEEHVDREKSAIVDDANIKDADEVKAGGSSSEHGGGFEHALPDESSYINQDDLSSTPKSSSRILQDTDRRHHYQHRPYFYYQNSTFLLSTRPNDNTALYNNYGTTLTIIVLLHLVYFYQWNTRRTREEVCTSYDQLVEKKQFYRAVLATVSHPPVGGGGERVDNTSSLSIGGATQSLHGILRGRGRAENNDGGPVQRRGAIGRFVACNMQQRLRPLFDCLYQHLIHPFVYGHLSGLPLLTYSSHILWQCRALEELYDEHGGDMGLGVIEANVTEFAGIGTSATEIEASTLQNMRGHFSSLLDHDCGYSYFRVIVALAFTSILLELSLVRSILRRLDGVVTFGGYRTTPTELLSQRSMCSMASLSAALLCVYGSHFPHAPPPVLPFLPSTGFSSWLSIFMLSLLTHRIHPLTSIVSGLLSGLLFSFGVTSILGTWYWGNFMISTLGAGVLLSLKAQPTYSSHLLVFLPCLDYVSWREEELNVNTPRFNDTQGTQSRNIHGDHERSPFLMPQISSMSGGSSIRGRVPLINRMES